MQTAKTFSLEIENIAKTIDRHTILWYYEYIKSIKKGTKCKHQKHSH